MARILTACKARKPLFLFSGAAAFLALFLLFESIQAETPAAGSAAAPIRSSAASDFYVDNSCTFNGNGTRQTCATAVGNAGPFNSLANAQNGLAGSHPGSRLLFRAGQRFTGMYTLRASGTVGHPFTVSSYGAGAKPVFDAAGALYAIGVIDISHVVIDGVAVTNGVRGIWISREAGHVNGVIIRNNEVYNNPQIGIAYHSKPGPLRGDAADSAIHDNDISGSAAAIYIMRVNNLKIYRNLCRDNAYPNGHEPMALLLRQAHSMKYTIISSRIIS